MAFGHRGRLGGWVGDSPQAVASSVRVVVAASVGQRPVRYGHSGAAAAVYRAAGWADRLAFAAGDPGCASSAGGLASAAQITTAEAAGRPVWRAGAGLALANGFARRVRRLAGQPGSSCFRDDREQQSLVLWGTWLLTMGVFYSVAGFFHQYYLSTFAPAIAALFGIGLVVMSARYGRFGWRGWLLPIALLLTAAEQISLIEGDPTWGAWLIPLIALPCLVAAVLLFGARLFAHLRALWVPAPRHSSEPASAGNDALRGPGARC